MGRRSYALACWSLWSLHATGVASSFFGPGGASPRAPSSLCQSTGSSKPLHEVLPWLHGIQTQPSLVLPWVRDAAARTLTHCCHRYLKLCCWHGRCCTHFCCCSCDCRCYSRSIVVAAVVALFAHVLTKLRLRAAKHDG